MSTFLIFVAVQFISYSAGANWSYRNQDIWPDSCRGNLQSPIALSSENATSKHFEPFVFRSHSAEKNTVNIVNNGHSVDIRLVNTTNTPTISGGGLDGEYVLEAFHFHWGAEHTLDGHRFPLEGHFVYFARKHKTFQNARKVKNGIAVLGVFYDVTPEDSPYFEFSSLVPKITMVNQQLSTTIGSLSDLLPNSVGQFYRYEGSLTTPNCDEVVFWTVFSSPSFISLKQLKDLTSIHDESGKPLKVNFRRLQKRNKRPVYRTEF